MSFVIQDRKCFRIDGLKQILTTEMTQKSERKFERTVTRDRAAEGDRSPIDSFRPFLESLIEKPNH